MKHTAEAGNGSKLLKALLRVSWFPSARLRPALRVHYHHRGLMCSVLPNSQHKALSAELREQLTAQLINPALQLGQCLHCKHNPAVPLPLLWQRMPQYDNSFQTLPCSSPEETFAPVSLGAVRGPVSPPTWPIFKSQVEVSVSCLS